MQETIANSAVHPGWVVANRVSAGRGDRSYVNDRSDPQQSELRLQAPGLH